MHPLVAFALLLAITTLFGALMGAIIHYLEMPAFIVTLAGMTPTLKYPVWVPAMARRKVSSRRVPSMVDLRFLSEWFTPVRWRR